MIMASSTKTQTPGQPSSTEDWTVVLARRGKKIRPFPKLDIPKKHKSEQPWVPVRLETDPERESRLKLRVQNSIKKLENSEFCHYFFDQMQSPDMWDRFMKVLGSENQMKMVIYGIGSIEMHESPRWQLSLAILIKRKFSWIGDMEVFDPIISLTESNVLTSLGCTVLAVNEDGRRLALKPTMFFMLHCEAFLYDNLLEANWGAGHLKNLSILGNSFSEYEQQSKLFPDSHVTNSSKHILAARHFTEEFKVCNSYDDSFRAFHVSSWHFFNPTNETDLQL